LLFEQPRFTIKKPFSGVFAAELKPRLMFYGLQLFLLLALTVPLALLTIAMGPFDPHGKRVYRIGQFWTWLIVRMGGIAIAVRGLENLSRGRSYIFMANHQSNIDIPVLVQSLLDFQLRWIAKKELLNVPLFGWAMRAGKHVAVDRADSAGALQSLEEAKALLAAGVSIVVFPEGTRSRDGRLLPFKKGGFLLAVQTGAEIVPVTILGSRTVLPSGEWRVRSGSIAVFVGPPIALGGYRRGKLKPLADQVRQQIAARLNETDPRGPGRGIPQGVEPPAAERIA
jgi:1-acyl-sn-glycerol-3-phosphate acyltransferase